MAPLAAIREANGPVATDGRAVGGAASGLKTRLRRKDSSVRSLPLDSESAIEHSAWRDVRQIFELAGRIEASAEGQPERHLARQIIETLGELSRILQLQEEPSSDLARPGALAGFAPDHLSNISRSPDWVSLIAELTSSHAPSSPLVSVVDRDPTFRSAICLALEAEGLTVETFATCEQFLRAETSGGPACLIINSDLPGMGGLKLLRTLGDRGHALPVIVVAGPCDVHTAVEALKAGVVDFLEKPIGCDDLLSSVERALVRAREQDRLKLDHDAAAKRLLALTPRQRQVMDLILAGHPSKNIATDIGVSQRTVESHRAEVMRKTGAKSMPALAQLAAKATFEASTPLRFDFGPPGGHAAAVGNDQP